MHTLPVLPYAYEALEPYLDAQTVELHHDLHHKAYVDGLNAAEQKIAQARKSGDFSVLKSACKDLAFHGAGHFFHSMFWTNLAPKGGGAEGEIDDPLATQIMEDFGNLAALKKQFTAVAIQVEGSGWAVLGVRKDSNTLVIHQIEKHQDLAVYGVEPILVCDLWEHAYYLKYQNRRAEWLENFWHIVNWNNVGERYKRAVE